MGKKEKKKKDPSQQCFEILKSSHEVKKFQPLSLLQNPQYDIKDSTSTLHSGITQTAAYYPYDHSLGQYQYDR